MFKLYYAAAIDTCPEKALKQIEEFKKVFSIYMKEGFSFGDSFDGSHNEIIVKHPIEVYGAGFGDSPIIGPETSAVKKGVISAFDLRKIRECDMLLVVTDLRQFAAGTFMELEYARNLGIYTILFCYGYEEILKNIFLETYANTVISSMGELEEILKDLT